MTDRASTVLVDQYINKKVFEDAVWSDKFMLIVLALHLPFIIYFVPNGYGTHLQGAVPGVITIFASFFAYYFAKGTLLSRAVIAVSLMIMSMIVIMQQLGRIEMHFHIFSMLAFLIIWRDWKVLLIGALAIAIHHLVSVPLQLANITIGGVPYVPYGDSCDWPTFFLHATFVVLETAILVFFSIRLRAQFTLANHVAAILSTSSKHSDLTLSFEHIKARSEGDKAFIESLSTFYLMIKTSFDHLQNISSALNGVASESVEVAEANRVQLTRQNTFIMDAASSVDTMNATLLDISQTTQSTAKATADAQSLALASDVKVNETVQQMQALTEQINTVKGVIDQLAADTLSISSTTDIINSIAEQTNLLALNAAIEAARAGEQGRGFAVVAEEVRALALRSGMATKEISDVIENLTSSASHAVSVMDKSQEQSLYAINIATQTNELLTKVTSAMDDIAQMSDKVAMAMQEQKSSSTSVSENMNAIKASNLDSQEKVNSATQLSTDVAHMTENLLAVTMKIKTKDEVKK